MIIETPILKSVSQSVSQSKKEQDNTLLYDLLAISFLQQLLCHWHLITCVWFFPSEGSRVVAGNSESWPHYIKLHPTQPTRATLFWALFLLIYISTLMPTICFCALFPSISQGPNKSPQIWESADEMQKYGVKMKAEVLDSGWYLFVCWLHMFGFGFPGFAGFPPRDRHSTLPALILS